MGLGSGNLPVTHKEPLLNYAPPRKPPYKNRLLACLSPGEIERIAPHLSPVDLKLHRTLHSSGKIIDTVYFIEEGLASVVVTMKDGATVEVGMVGREGFVGMPAVLSSGRSPNHVFMQIPGHGFSIKAKVFREQSGESKELRSCLQKAVQGFLVQTAQTAACNRIHELEERLARWLLMCHDRIQSEQLPMTHEFLAMMLGTRRSSVSVAAGMLHKAGLIEYSRGHVTIKSRAHLLNAACECYQVVHNEYVDLGLL